MAGTLLAPDSCRTHDQALHANWLFTATAGHPGQLFFVLEAVVSTRFSFYHDRFCSRDKTRPTGRAKAGDFRRFRTALIASCHNLQDYTEPGYVLRMRCCVVIPARMGSTRFPGKPLCDLLGKPMVQWVVEAARKAEIAERVVVATPDEEIRQVCVDFGAEAILTSP